MRLVVLLTAIISLVALTLPGCSTGDHPSVAGATVIPPATEPGDGFHPPGTEPVASVSCGRLLRANFPTAG